MAVSAGNYTTTCPNVRWIQNSGPPQSLHMEQQLGWRELETKITRYPTIPEYKSQLQIVKNKYGLK